MIKLLLSAAFTAGSLAALSFGPSIAHANEVYAGIRINTETVNSNITADHAMISALLDGLEINDTPNWEVGYINFTCSKNGSIFSITVPELGTALDIDDDQRFDSEVRLMGNGGLDDYGTYQAMVRTRSGSLTMAIMAIGVHSDPLSSLADGGNLWVRSGADTELGQMHLTVFSPVRSSNLFTRNSAFVAPACDLY